MPAGSKSPKISDIAITCKGVAKLLLNSNHSKAAGIDELKHRLLKKKQQLPNEISPISTIYIFVLFKSLNTGAIPNIWKTAHVVSRP